MVFPLYVGGLAGLAAVVASGGALALVIAGIIVGTVTGAGVGGLLANAIAEHHYKRVEEQVVQGGLVLWVKVAGHDAERRALAVLKKARAHDIHIHQIRRQWGPNDMRG